MFRTNPMANTASAEERMGKRSTAAAAANEKSTTKSLLVFMVFIFIVVPVVVIVLSFVFGGMLAGLEKWSIMDGFYYVISNLLGLANPLTDVNPTSNEGKFLDIVVSLWALALAGTIIGIVGSMSVIGILVDWAEKFKFKFGGRQDLQDLKKATSENKRGLDFDEFLATLNAGGPPWPADVAMRLFERLDKDRSGVLDREEVERVQNLRDFMLPSDTQ